MEDKDLYTLALLRYKDENPNIDINNSFTTNWVLSKDYRLKTIIIAKAIKNHVLIEDTELYQEHFLNKNKQ